MWVLQVPLSLLEPTYTCLCIRKTTINKKRKNDCGYVLIKLVYKNRLWARFGPQTIIICQLLSLPRPTLQCSLCILPANQRVDLAGRENVFIDKTFPLLEKLLQRGQMPHLHMQRPYNYGFLYIYFFSYIKSFPNLIFSISP